MQQLHRVRFCPEIKGKKFVRDVQLQIIYAIKNRAINVYRVPDDPYALEFECTPEERDLIQSKVNEAMGYLWDYFRDYTLTYLFVNGLYVGNKPVVLEALAQAG